MAAELDVVLSTRVRSLEAVGKEWHVNTEEGGAFRAGALVLALPVPQALTILEEGTAPVPAATRASLKEIIYDPCMAVMAVLDGPSGIPAPGGLQADGEPISWMADNQAKGISPDVPAVTVHAGPEFSHAYWDADRVETGRRMLEAVSSWIGARPVDVQVHGWRYAQPRNPHPDRCLSVDDGPPLVLAGDAFGGPRVEGAALSGLAAAEAVLERLPAR
jgi:predicted NAD/FAD-dependent oxidoreductase